MIVTVLVGDAAPAATLLPLFCPASRRSRATSVKIFRGTGIAPKNSYDAAADEGIPVNVTVERSLRTLEAGRLAALSPYFPVALALAGIALLLYGAGSRTVVQDTWSTLVAGREVAHSGLPSVDHLTVLGAGHRWTDQQWLAQLALYGAELVGGLKAAVLVGAAAALLAYAIVLRSAQRQPGFPGAVYGAAMLAITVRLGVPGGAQELALPLGAGVLALLLSDPAATRRRTLLVLPLLCLWANVHGSVVLGAGIVCLYGLTLFVPGGINRRTARRAAPFLLLSPLTVFVSPYGFDLVAYYRLLLVDPPFKHLIQEWEPPRPAAGTRCRSSSSPG